jgi:hypothetical protein
MNDGTIRIYMITFFVDPQTNLPTLHQYLTDSVDVLGYWNYIPLVYCVKTRLDATQLSTKFAPFFPSGFMIAEINPNNLNGRLVPEEAWKWFYEAPTPKHLPLLEGLGGILGLSQLPPPPKPK